MAVIGVGIVGSGKAGAKAAIAASHFARSFGSASHRSKAASSGGILTRSEGCESRIASRLDMQLSL